MLFLDEKVKEAISFLRENEPKEGYIVKFSGGKDSIVLLDLVKKAGVKYEARYNFTCLEPPEVLRFMKKNYPEVKWIKPKKSFWQYLERVGPPTKARRWCCTKLKHAVSPDEKGRKVLVGIRADESRQRLERGRIVKNKDGKNIVLAPLFYFTEDEVWYYIEEKGLAVPELYFEGFSRIACVVCPFLCGEGKNGSYRKLLLRHMERWRKFYDRFELGVRRWFESKKNFWYSVGIYDADEVIDRWYRNKKLYDDEEELREEENGIEGESNGYEHNNLLIFETASLMR